MAEARGGEQQLADPRGPDPGALFLEHRDAMYRAAYAFAGASYASIAEDAVQEVMISIMTRYPSGVRNWRSYLVTSVVNKIRDIARSPARREQPANESDVVDVLSLERALGDYAGDPLEEVVDAVERETIVARVRLALDELREKDSVAADVLWQVKVMGKTSVDVATEMGVSDSRVRQIVMRAKRSLKASLQDLEAFSE